MKTFTRFITCGSVDDGKSTLIGRLLFDSKQIYDDQIKDISKDGKIDFANLLDGLESEREQGITIDVAYRFFNTKNKKYIIADTPGHEQYTRNMVTGASTADIAIILIDARKGVLKQTKRHSFITALLGIKHIIVAVNKMDLVDFSSEVFEKIKRDYEQIIPNLPNYKNIYFHFVPISALNGDNILYKSENTPWFKHRSLMQILDETEINEDERSEFRFPVQFVLRPNLDYRAYLGNIVSGSIGVGDEILVLPSKKVAKIKQIIGQDIKDFISNDSGSLNHANSPFAVSFVLDREIDISRGDIFIKNGDKFTLSKKIAANIVWFSEKPLNSEQDYLIKCACKTLNAKFNKIAYKFDINTFDKLKADTLELNDIASCELNLGSEILCDLYDEFRMSGSFIVIDKYTNETLGAGMISANLQEKQKLQKRIYTNSEIALNKFIRENFPEWECREIY